jgi:ADP-ribosylglycohydrolase
MTTNNIEGLIYGQALGDAIGLTTEFMTKEDIIKIYGEKLNNYNFDLIFQDYHRKNWKKGDWTDDTDQFILILQMIYENNIDKHNFAKKIFNWLEKGFPDCDDNKSYGVGNTLSIWWGDKYIFIDPIISGIRAWIYNPIYPINNISNGSLMRTSILGIIKNKNLMFEKTIEISSVTHPDPSCILACLFVVNLIHNILYNNLNIFNDEIFDYILKEIKQTFINYCKNLEERLKTIFFENDELNDVIQENLKNFKGFNIDNILKEFKNYIKLNSFDEIKLNENIGHCFKPIACACIILKKINEKNFLEHIIDLVKEGGDSDTNCAIVGGIIGSYYGLNNLPIELINQMPYIDFLKKEVLNLHNSEHH